MAEFLYTPSDWGRRFHTLHCREGLGAGAAGPGKTQILLHDCDSRIAMEHDRSLLPSNHPAYQPLGSSMGWALHLRRNRSSLENTIARSHLAFRRMDPGAHWDSQRSTWRFSSGYHYTFGHCKDPDDWQQYLSQEFDWIGFDELVEFDKEQYIQIESRCRSSDKYLRMNVVEFEINGEQRSYVAGEKVRAMSNPVMVRAAGVNLAVKDPQWVRKYFVDPCPEGGKLLTKQIKRPDGRVEKRQRIYLPARLRDNPDKEFVDSYEVTLLDKPAHIRRAMLEGDWYVSAGSFFDGWRPDLHVIRPFRVPEHWPIFRSMDWGFKSPGCIHWWAIDPDDNLYCIREYSFQKKHPPEVAQRVREIEEHDLGIRWRDKTSPLSGPADTQIWEERGDSTKRKVDEFAECGVQWVQANKRSRSGNAAKISQRLDDHDGGTSMPGLMFFETCRQVIKTLPGIQTSRNDPESPEDGGEDHWYDSTAYACAYASHGAKSVPYRGDDDDDEPAEERVERGQYGYGLH